MTRPAESPAESVPLLTDTDVVRARHAVREHATAVGLDLVGQTKIITAASELARNTVLHGRGGDLTLSTVHGNHDRVGLQLVFTDHGPGIADVERAMTGGWSSGTGLGLGLPGSRRLVHEFELNTVPGQGTSIRVVYWRRDG